MASRMKISNHPRNYTGTMASSFVAGHNDAWTDYKDSESPRKKRRKHRPKIGVYRRKADETVEVEAKDLQVLEQKGWKVSVDETETEEDENLETENTEG